MPSSRSTSSPARFEYSIKAVKETRFLLSSLQQLQVESIEVSRVRNEYYHKWGYHPDKEEFTLDFRIVFAAKEHVLIDYGVQMLFEVHALETGNMPEQLLLNFYGITISTIRGMLVTRLMGSDYTRMFVPIFYPSEIRELFLRQ